MSHWTGAHPLDDSRAKIDHAKKHADALDADFRAWLTESSVKPKGVVIEKQRDPLAGEIHFVVESTAETPPFRWGLRLGDIIHNLRGALDHLAFALADLDSPNRGEDEKTQFVIASTPTAFRSTAGQRLRHLNTRHRTMMEKEQPYQPPNSPDSHPLTNRLAEPFQCG